MSRRDFEKYRNPGFDAGFIDAHPAQQADVLRSAVTPYRGRPFRWQRGNRRGRGRQQYQQRRNEDFRQNKSKITEHDLSMALKNKLFPGIKDGQTAAERVEAVNTLKAITICITTRTIGFGTTHLFACLYEYNNVPVRGSIY
ncbi:unnamed protein product [Acanthoscelides obtectus]|uniref:Uncharacterized protein n=1 Tax=Acanthoscelides obtectus TaxID=200917 RepID=A0A9P0PIY6_ACAOB|nr:unnamed protein product [Acanthoscelides obtectus]CAK1674605.1 hypothetical protein AOBTE_LOCUS29676 [Acanthoscelides obtectus]